MTPLLVREIIQCEALQPRLGVHEEQGVFVTFLAVVTDGREGSSLQLHWLTSEVQREGLVLSIWLAKEGNVIC